MTDDKSNTALNNQRDDLDRVVFHSTYDLASGYHLKKGEHILRSSLDIVVKYTNINDILELYNIKNYIDNNVYLNSWSEVDISIFKNNVLRYGEIIGSFLSSINDSNFLTIQKETIRSYKSSFWELTNNQSIYKRVSSNTFKSILVTEPHLIYEILTHKKIVEHFDQEISDFLIHYPQAAEILISFYEVKDEIPRKTLFIPKKLTIKNKEIIISTYLDSDDTNINYVNLIQTARNRNDFRISDKTRLKARRLHKAETKNIISKNSIKYGVSINFPKDTAKIKHCYLDNNLTAHYYYSFNHIAENCDYYSIFKNFKVLFEYVDNQNRINLISKKNQIGVFERIVGISSSSEYKIGAAFSLSEMASHGQIYGYSKVLNELNIDLIDVLHLIYTSTLPEIYDYPSNARFVVPSQHNSHFEKVRILAPEFESILKQFKIYVEEKHIDYELLQISSSPCNIRDIPSLNENKYIYLNDENHKIISGYNMFFSDQTLLSYVKPFENSHYTCFFELLEKEQVHFDNYEEHHKPQLKYLIDNKFIHIDSNGIIQVTNVLRLLIVKDLYDNEVGVFHHYPIDFQNEALKMASENIISFESSLLSRPEQSYLNYILNKSEFTNGLDLRNSYLHGTQANPEYTEMHDYAYYTYLKILFLIILKIEDDLAISKVNNN